MEASSFDDHRPESSHQNLREGPPLDIEHAKLSLQHVRALNKQFASWVQSQLQNSLDELWIDGVRDYLTHASNILVEFKDIVDWLRENASKSQTRQSTNLPCQPGNADATVTNITSPNVIIPASLSLSKSIDNQIPLFGSKSTQYNPSPIAAIESSEVTVPANASSSQTSTLLFSSQSLLNSKLNNECSKKATSTSFPLIQSSNIFSSSQSGCFFSSSVATSPIFPGIQSSTQQKVEISDDADEGGEVEHPSSPSLQKVEERGVSIVHEVKCKVFIKDNLSETRWRDLGAGNLSIKCKEGAEKATKESKPTLLFRNDVGKILLNALIYPGIKMSIQKTSIVSIFHTTGGGGDDSSGEAVARAYLLRLKSLEDTAKLAEIIKEYTPSP